MTIRVLHRACTAPTIIAVFAALFSGCEADRKPEVAATANVVQKRDPAIAADTGAGGPKSVTGQTNARVELTDCSSVATGERQYTFAVKYRFTAGQPDPRREYVINVQLVGVPFVETKRIPGSQLQKEGELTWEYQSPDISLKNNPRPKEIKMTFMEQVGSDGNRSRYFGISDEVTGACIDR